MATSGASPACSTTCWRSASTDSDRLCNFARRFHPQWFGQLDTNGTALGDDHRHDPAQQTHIGTRDGRLYVLGPPFGSEPVEVGPVSTWMATARAAGY